MIATAIKVASKTPVTMPLGNMALAQYAQKTAFAETDVSYTKYWLGIVEKEFAPEVDYATPLSCDFEQTQFGGWPLPFRVNKPEKNVEKQSPPTLISLQNLVGRLFHRPVAFTADFPQISNSAVSALEDLNVSYFTRTAVLVCPNQAEQVIANALTEIRTEPKSRIVARQLADFLGITLDELGKMTKIGRTTFSSWLTKNPRPATLRDLYRLEALVASMRSNLGDEGTRTWLHTGSPSPFSLLKNGQLEQIESRASSLLFSPRLESKSLGIVPYEDEPMGRPANAQAKPLPGIKRAKKGALLSEPR